MEVQKTVHEFEHFPEDWCCTTVAGLVSEGVLERPIDGNHGETHPKGTDFVPSGIPFVMATDIYNGRIDLKKCKFITLERAQSLRKGFARQGDVLLTHKASLGRTALVPETKHPFLMLTPQVTYYRVLDKKRISNAYLMYFFNSPFFQDTLSNHGDAGSTRSYVGITAQLDLPVAFPRNIAEQRAIAGVLSSLDDKIDLLHRQNKTLESLAETLFRQWFIEEAQDDWEEATFGDHFDVVRGLSYKGDGLTTPGMGIPMHNLNSVLEGGGYKEQGIKYYSGEYKDRHTVTPGDIIVANTEQGHEYRLIGYPAIVSAQFGQTGIFSQHLYKVSPNDKTYLSREFIYFLVMTTDVREQVIAATNGSTVNMLSIDGLQRPTFRLPPRSQVLRFTAASKRIMEKVNRNSNSIHTLGLLRDTLLPKMMSGEVRVELGCG